MWGIACVASVKDTRGQLQSLHGGSASLCSQHRQLNWRSMTLDNLVERIQSLRLRKLLHSLTHVKCWMALSCGVAPSVEHQHVLERAQYDCAIDVGANRGQFALISKLVNPEIPVVSFEPLSSEASVFRRIMAKYEDVSLCETAIGESRGQALLHVSRSADCSSLLAIGESQQALYRNTSEIRTVATTVDRLDAYKARWQSFSRILLKIDVQGFELSVLKGAIDTLQQCAFVIVECSEIELYEGQALSGEILDFLGSRNFAFLSRYNESVVGGDLIQADYLFAPKSRSGQRTAETQ